MEGVAGVTFLSNIAVDDFSFSRNLTCVSVGKPTPPETFEGIDFRSVAPVHLAHVSLCTRRNPELNDQGRVAQSNPGLARIFVV